MAHRDRSQGFGFVYVDLAKILAERDNLDKVAETGPVHPTNIPSYNFNKDPRPAAVPPEAVEAAPVVKKPEPTAAIQQIRENLDRLKSLHHKLHAMLEELNQLTDREKKKK